MVKVRQDLLSFSQCHKIHFLCISQQDYLIIGYLTFLKMHGKQITSLNFCAHRSQSRGISKVFNVYCMSRPLRKLFMFSICRIMYLLYKISYNHESVRSLYLGFSSSKTQKVGVSCHFHYCSC